MGKLIRRSRTLGFRPKRRRHITSGPSWLGFGWLEPERRRIRTREHVLPEQADVERRLSEAFGEEVKFDTPGPESLQRVEEELERLGAMSQVRQPQPSIVENSSEATLVKRRLEESRRR